MPYIWKVLWSRRRRKKQNKLLFIKYQSYHRHHLIRISSCHTLQRAKKTKKTKILLKQKSNRKKNQLPSRFIHLSHRRSEFKLKMSHCNIHSILLESGAPSHKNCSMWKKRAMQDTLLISEKPLLLSYRGKKKNLYIANFYVTRNIILQSASCFQHFCCQI